MSDKNHLENKLRDKGKTDEEQYFAKRERELLERLKQAKEASGSEEDPDD